MANYGWAYLINSTELAEQKVRVRIEEQIYGDLVIPVKHVTPGALEGPGTVRNLVDWIEEELEHGRSEEGEGAYLVKEFFFSYGVPGITPVAQFEPEWMFVHDLDVLSEGYPAIRERLGLGARSPEDVFDTIEKAWEPQAGTLPRAIQLLRRLRGWCLLTREDMAYLQVPFECAPEDALHCPGEWEEVFHQHQTQHYDFAALLFDSML
jgi:hypothetical protein